jgi:predicted phosphodiesterase
VTIQGTVSHEASDHAVEHSRLMPCSQETLMSAIRLAVISDLHLEFRNAVGCDLAGLDLAATADILLVPGDVAIGTDAITWCERSPIPVVFVPGNHEFYGREISSTRDEMRVLASQYRHVHLLDPGVVQFNIRQRRIRVIGATLWTDYRLLGEKHRVRAMEDASRGLNDHRVIKLRAGPWRPEEAAAEFDRSKAFIAAELERAFQGLTVVATHHAPSSGVVHPKYQGDHLSAAFASDLDDLVSKSDVWVYGHTHSNIEIEIGRCRVISNQRGYRHENPGWAPRIYEF